MIFNNQAGKENLNEVLSEQDSLIAQISAALESKAAPSGATYETCEVTLDIRNPGSTIMVAYTRLNGSGEPENWAFEASTSGADYTSMIQVVKGTYIHIFGTVPVTYDVTPAEAGTTLAINESAIAGYGRSYVIYETAPDSATVMLEFD